MGSFIFIFIFWTSTYTCDLLNFEVTDFIGFLAVFGSALGGILLVISLYAVLWGKSKEQKLENQHSFQAKAAKEHKQHRETEATTSEKLLSA